MALSTDILGFKVGFFPSRPTTGQVLRSIEAIDDLFGRLGNAWVIQPKLNGDRAVLVVNGDQVAIHSRYGTPYTHTVQNLKLFHAPGTWVYDGEVYQKEFLPFEVLRTADKDLSQSCVTDRIAEAEVISRRLGIRWEFSAPSRDQLVELFNSYSKSSNPLWEGVVRKAKFQPYVQGRVASEPTKGCYKHKWS